jgi:hypothetical protein
MNKPSAVSSPESGLHLSVTMSPEGLTIHQVARVRHAPRGHLRPPLLAQAWANGMSAPATEIAIYTLDLGGGIQDEFGWPYWVEEFFDIPLPPKQGGLTGSPVSTLEGFRLWRFPVREDARFVLVMRSEVRPGEAVAQLRSQPARAALEQRTLAFLWLGPGPIPEPPVWPPAVPPPIPGLHAWPAPTLLPAVRILDCRTMASAAAEQTELPPPMRPSGGLLIDKPGNVVQHGQPDSCFNIVVMGDGFQQAEMGLYDQRVAALACHLQHIAPFDRVWKLMNVWSVRAWSKDSGISLEQYTDPDAGTTHPPVYRDTYFGFTGCFRGKPNPGYVGTYNPCRLLEAAATLVPLEYVQLVIAIANTPYYGGRGIAASRMAFATMWNGLYAPAVPPLTPPSDMKEWARLVSHECGHAIAGLAEERVVGVAKDPAITYPNQATIDEVDEVGGAVVPWKSLAWAMPAHPYDELGSDGRFRAIHKCGTVTVVGSMPICGAPINNVDGQPMMAPEYLYTMLGAFWGCQSFDVGAQPVPLCDQYRDARGRNFFRPMSECRMRQLRFEFCRVCDKAIADRIAETCV